MTVIWTNEVLIATLSMVVIFLLSAYWTKDFKKITFLLLGFIGLWLSMVAPNIQVERKKITSKVKDISEFLLSDKKEKTDTIILVGDGHHLDDIALLKAYNIVQESILETTGFAEISIPKVKATQTFIVKGKVVLAQDSIQKIWMELSNNKEFEAPFEKDGSFAVQIIAPTTGLYEYKLKGKFFSGDTISEIVPIEVESTEKLRMLILAANPDFELNYLKNYWVSYGHAVVQKIKISKEKYSTSFLNMNKFNLQTLNTEVWDRFDMVYLDIPSWNALSFKERNDLLDAFENKGLGIILKPTELGQNVQSLPFLKVTKFYDEEIKTVPITLIKTEQNKEWENIEFGSLLQKGIGKIIVLKINDSYKLMLNEQEELYKEIWTDIFSELFIKLTDDFVISLPFLNFEDQIFDLQFNYASQDSKYYLNDSIPLAINFTPMLEGNGVARIAGKLGWNKVSDSEKMTERWFYTFGMNSWKVRQADQMRTYISYLNKIEKTNQNRFYKASMKFPWWISLMILVVGFGMVWVLDKLK